MVVLCDGKPAWRQVTLAAKTFQLLGHSLPQRLLMQISTTPSAILLPLTKRISPWWQLGVMEAVNALTSKQLC